MLDHSSLLLFVAASAAVLLAPGPAVLYIVARSMNQGRAVGVVAVLGLETGTLVQVAAASLDWWNFSIPARHSSSWHSCLSSLIRRVATWPSKQGHSGSSSLAWRRLSTAAMPCWPFALGNACTAARASRGVSAFLPPRCSWVWV